MIYDSSQSAKRVRTEAPKPTIHIQNSVSQIGNSKETEKKLWLVKKTGCP